MSLDWGRWEVTYATDIEEKTLQVLELSSSYREKTSGLIGCGACSRLVCRDGV